jgi:glutaredoxin
VSYALQQAVKNFPVTLYSAGQCGNPCRKASALLAQRGVPFSEKNARDATVEEELKALNGGKLEVPILKVGAQVVRGYDEGNWNGVLDAAGYPKWSATPTRAATAVTKPAQPAGKPAAPAGAAPQNDAAEPERE